MATGHAPTRMASEQRAQAGPHLLPWLAEFVGTGLVLFVGVLSIGLFLGGPVGWFSLSHSLGLLVVGLIFGATAAAFSLTALGRRSGAHLNPVITLGFWALGKVHWHDVAGYVCSQLLGSIVGTGLAGLVWDERLEKVSFGATRPGYHVSNVVAAALEAAMALVLLLCILLMVSSSRTARYIPLAVVVLISVFVWQLAPFTGASFNPARSLGPALLANVTSTYWIYVVGPLVGGAAAVGVFKAIPTVHVLTTKLFHDPRYPSTMASSLAVAGRDPGSRL